MCAAASPADSKTAVIGYVFPDGAAIQQGEIDPLRLTRINYAFAAIRNGQMVADSPEDAQNLALLTSLRQQNPSLTVLISVGGWNGSGGFSDVALTPASRALFIHSAIALIGRYHLDGLDVDWEYPGQPGDGNRFRSQDKQNFTLLLQGLRGQFDRETAGTGRRLYLTIAAEASEEYLDRTEMAGVQRYVDSVNLMAYDFYEPGSDPITGPLAPLFVSPGEPKQVSANQSVLAFEQAGVPAAKIVLGVPFYGRAWSGVANRNHGLYQPGKPAHPAELPYNRIAGTMLRQGFTRYWDSAASVPYLYNPDRHIFVTYEDPQSLAAKCHYVLTHRLAGVMFWDYSSDPSGTLLGTIDKAFHLPETGPSPSRGHP